MFAVCVHNVYACVCVYALLCVCMCIYKGEEVCGWVYVCECECVSSARKCVSLVRNVYVTLFLFERPYTHTTCDRMEYIIVDIHVNTNRAPDQ